MKELVVIAEKEELKLVEKLGFHIGYPILITGVGPLNVIEALKDVPKDTRIINIGYAGSKDLKPGDFYLVDQVSLNHPNVCFPEHGYKCNVPYVFKDKFEVRSCLTGCDFVLESKLGNCLFDMELAYIMALGFDYVTSLKYVSDNLDLQEYRKKANSEE